MPYIRSNPDTFVDDALAGLALVHADTVRRVDGGVVAATPLPPGHVALVIGGGSGHYPAFAGTVGPGMAAGAVCGHVFTSPSAGQAYRVAREAHAGGGVIFSYGNYAGDVLHFGEAERRLRDEGVDCRTVLVTDDVASAPVEDRDKRRGIAGDFVVFKIAGAAAAEGLSMDEVERAARHANARTVTMGVAFSGCTVPGADAPLFTVPAGQMSVGLGIHGEPGVRDVPTPDVAELAAALIEPLLAERPADHGGRVGIVVNGLGTVKYEELFVLTKHVWNQLEDAGLSIAVAESGELVTSLDMAGASLTVTWLDEDLERWWLAPAYTPAYRRGAMVPEAAQTSASTNAHLDAAASGAAAAVAATMVGASAGAAATAALSQRQREANQRIVRLLEAARTTVDRHCTDLGDLDAFAGDGDHGTGMLRGLNAALTFAHAHSDTHTPADLITGAADAWSEHAGGTSGALWAAALRTLAAQVSDSPWTAQDLATAGADAVQAVQILGKAQVGDKTMVDAMVPWAQELADAAGQGATVAQVLDRAALVASAAAATTAQLSPALGRARPLAERSIGHQDPGATSFGLIATAVAQAVADHGDHPSPRQETS